jgi:hypothetical protein
MMEEVFAILFGVVCGILAGVAAAAVILYGMAQGDRTSYYDRQVQEQMYTKIIVDSSGTYIVAGEALPKRVEGPYVDRVNRE